MNIFVFGLGYSALHYVRSRRSELKNIAGTVRGDAKRADLCAESIDTFIFSAEARDNGLIERLRASENLIVSIGPDASGDPVLNAFAPELMAAPVRRIVYLSTVGVYGDHGGGWVDEQTPPKPASTRSRWRLEAENRWLDFAREKGCDLHILRLAGIYGPGRNALENLHAGKARRIVKAGQVFNRIHVEDIAQAIHACLLRPAIAEQRIWNVTDNEPSPPQDVVAYAAQIAGLPAPPEIAFKDADMTPMARSFYGENKRVSNRALCEELGVALAFPTYREGLLALCNQLEQGRSTNRMA